MRNRILLLSVALSMLALMAFAIGRIASPAHAANITVTTNADELNADGDCSLREAIAAANTDAAVDACSAGSGADVITVPAGTYTLSILGAGEDTAQTGDLDVTATLTIVGAGIDSTIIDSGAIDRVFHVTSGDFTVSDLTIRNGAIAASGGGIFDFAAGGALTLTKVRLADNTSSAGNDGGGLRHASSGPLVIDNSIIEGNSAGGTGGGVVAGGDATITQSIIRNNDASVGGGIYNEATNLTIENTTISGNTAASGGGGILSPAGELSLTHSTLSGNSAPDGNGGGLWNSGAATIVNTTFSGNSGVDGGAIANSVFGKGCQQGDLSVLNTTIAGNSATDGAAGIAEVCGPEAILTNAIVANGPGANCSEPFVSGGHNLEDGNSCGFGAAGDQPNTEPQLGPLADNAGFTQTHALLAGSPAIDTADDAACPADDQRAVARPIDGDEDGTAACDIGAYELQPVAPTPTPTDPGGAIAPTAVGPVPTVVALPETGAGDAAADGTFWLVAALLGAGAAAAAAVAVVAFAALRLRPRS